LTARAWLFVSLLVASGISRADPLSVEPWVGLAGEYSSNPYLVSSGEQSVSDLAVLLRAPFSYVEDSTSMALNPSFRISDSGAYSSLASNYYRVNGNAQFTSEIDSLTFTGGLSRDSSLLYNVVANGGIGVRSDSTSAGIDWQRALSPRFTLETASAWTHVIYNEPTISDSLNGYRYLSVTPQLTYTLSERDSVSLSIGGGRYHTLDGISSSKSWNAQLAFNRALNEVWKFSGSAGYSVSDNSTKFYYGHYLLGTLDSAQKGPVFSASLNRPGELIATSLSLSRAYIPSGYVFLSRQNTAGASVTYTYSERWSLAAASTYQETDDALPTGGYASRHAFVNSVSVSWQWTPVWAVALHANYVQQSYQIPVVINVQSTGINLMISRQFYRVDL